MHAQPPNIFTSYICTYIMCVSPEDTSSLLLKFTYVCLLSPDHLEVVMREVYLPIMASPHDQHGLQYGISSDKLMDLIHRLVATMQVTSGLRSVGSDYVW